MFTRPYLSSAREFPDIPVETQEFTDFAVGLDIPIDPTVDIVPQLVAYTRSQWLDRSTAALDPTQAMPYQDVKQYKLLSDNGLIHNIEPQRERYDHVLVDGGTLRVYDYRLAALDTMLGGGITRDVTLFAGQRRRFTNDDSIGRLEDLAAESHRTSNDWEKAWIGRQLVKDPSARNKWDRPFAAEEDIATLALIRRYGSRLTHLNTTMRSRNDARTEVEGIPDAPIWAEEFSLDDTTIMRVLYGKAIRRSYAGQTPATPRPTARSCFAEWVQLVQPSMESTVLLMTHNPNIYRSWLDIMLGRVALGRTDLQIDGAGAVVENDRSYNYMLRAVSSIFINYHSWLYGNDGSHLAQSTWRT